MNLLELIAWLKANPDKASAGTSGVGGADHVTGISFQRLTGTRFGLVPYRGAALAMQDLIVGRIDLRFDALANSLPQLRWPIIKAAGIKAE